MEACFFILHQDRKNVSSDLSWESYRTDCYIAGRYQQELLSSGFFNPVMETLLQEASQFQEFVALLGGELMVDIADFGMDMLWVFDPPIGLKQ